MILFCDTSALVKLYLSEAGSDDMLAEARKAYAIAVCRIAWVEAMAAMARRGREIPEDADVLDLARARLRDHWQSFIVVEVSQPVVEQAGEFADTFALRAYDAVQLAAAQTLSAMGDDGVRFACFDARLVKAARVLGMEPVAA